jgi:hypothetical protein
MRTEMLAEILEGLQQMVYLKPESKPYIKTMLNAFFPNCKGTVGNEFFNQG